MKVTTIPYRPFNSANRITLSFIFLRGLSESVRRHPPVRIHLVKIKVEGKQVTSRKTLSSGISRMIKRRDERHYMHREKAFKREHYTEPFGRLHFWNSIHMLILINRVVVVYPVFVLFIDIIYMYIFILTADGWKFEILISLFELEISLKFRISSH